MIRIHPAPALALILPVLAALALGLPAAAQDEGTLIVAWIESGNLYAWHRDSGTARLLADGGVSRLFLLSPGDVIFTRGSEGQSESLWAVRVDEADPVEIVSADRLNPGASGVEGGRVIAQVECLGDGTIFFNTAFAYVMGGMRADDLWRVDLPEIARGLALQPPGPGQVEQILPDGQGCNFAVSPDGSLIALTTPGQYGGDTPGTVRLVDAQGQPVGAPFEFAGVSTASEYAFYPELHWLPEPSALRVAIPHPDLIYGAGQPAALVEIRRDGTAAQIGSADATFFGQPRWSPDGEWITTMRQVGPITDNVHEIVLARADGSDPQVIRAGAIGELEPPVWLGESGAEYAFTAGAPGEVWRGAPGVEPERFPTADEPAFGLIRAGAFAVYATAMAGPLELRYVTAADPSPVTIAALAEGYPVFDAAALGPP